MIVNVTGGLDMTLIEAEEASEIVNQAAGHGVNIWLGTSIDESLKDEIRVTVVATGPSRQGRTRQRNCLLTTSPLLKQDHVNNAHKLHHLTVNLI